MRTANTGLRRANLRRLLAPRSVALIGGRSLTPTIEILKRGGYKGTIHVVNPIHSQIGGIGCVPTVRDLPDTPDAAFISINRNLTIDTIEALRMRGAGGAVCFAAGFRELSQEGAALERCLAAAAGELAVVGPNSNGLLNRLDRLALWPVNDHDPVILDKGIAIIAQSGGIAGMFVRNRRGHNPAVVVSTGNQTLLEPADWLDVLGSDLRVTAIGMFLEGPGDVSALAEAAENIRSRGVPVVVFKSGRTALGVEMASTHTGALAGDDELFSALCERLGFIRTPTLARFLETLKLFNSWGPLPGRRVALLTASGSAKAMVADAAAEFHFHLPVLSSETAKKLRPLLPEFAHISNPLDHNAAYTGDVGLTMENEQALYECFRTVLADGFDLGIMHSESPEADEQGSKALRAWAKAAADTGTRAALLTLLPENMSSEAIAFCDKHGLLPLQGLEDGCFALESAMSFGELAIADEYQSSGALAAPVLWRQRWLLDERESKERLAKAGVEFPRWKVVPPGDVIEAARDIGYPVVLKAVSAALPHKSKMGAVVINLRNEAELVAALAQMQISLREIDIASDSFLVEEMVDETAAEVIVGIKSSHIYGHALVVGLGGIHVERSADCVSLLLPSSRGSIERGLGRLNVLDRVPLCAVPRLVDLAAAVSDFAMSSRHQLASLDLNPVIVTRRGRVVAVDALLELGVQ